MTLVFDTWNDVKEWDSTAGRNQPWSQCPYIDITAERFQNQKVPVIYTISWNENEVLIFNN